MPKKRAKNLAPAPPKYCLHKSSGQALVYVNGDEIYFGKYRSQESRERYNRLIAEWRQFVERLAISGIVSWEEIVITVCGELNPPQVGTAIASNKSFQEKFPPRQIMRALPAKYTRRVLYPL